MKKSKFIALILGIVGTLCFGIGMCMCMLSEWNSFNEGIVTGSIGILILVVTIFVYQKLEHKQPLHLSWRTVGIKFVAILGMLGLGTGMSLSMVYEMMIPGIILGVVGIMFLICLIPLCKGIESKGIAFEK